MATCRGSECNATLPEEIDEGAGVYCPECGLGQHIPDGGEDTGAAGTPDLPDPEDCDHEQTVTATDSDEAPTGVTICIDCGTEVEADA